MLPIITPWQYTLWPTKKPASRWSDCCTTRCNGRCGDEPHNPWRIVVYNVQSYERGWLTFIEERLAVASQWTKHSLYRHTLGAYYRLFWDQIIVAADNNQTAGEDDPPILYIDTDTVIMANLEHVWTSREETQQNLLFHWGQSHCSAFMLLQSQNIPTIWELYANTPNSTLQKLLRSRPVVDDQFILQAVHQEHPERVGMLPPEWDISVHRTVHGHAESRNSCSPTDPMERVCCILTVVEPLQRLILPPIHTIKPILCGIWQSIMWIFLGNGRGLWLRAGLNRRHYQHSRVDHWTGMRW